MRLLLLISTILLTGLQLQAQSALVLEGSYLGRNLYVQNPFAGNGVGFCTDSVYVNGKKTDDDIESSAFDIDLSKYGFQLYDKIKVQIFHKPDCKPKVLYDYPHGMRCNFEIISIHVDSSYILHWSTRKEPGKLPYVIEQFRWNKWVKVGEVDGKGMPDSNSYSFRLIPHSGENKVRVKQVDYRKPCYSKPVVFISKTGPIMPESPIMADMISFSDTTLYELYDSSGNLVKRGYARTIGLKKMPKGHYYINYDNKTSELIIRKDKITLGSKLD